MSAPRPFEDVLLSSVEDEIASALKQLGAKGHDSRLELLEAVACDIAEFDLDDYRALGGVTDTLASGALRAHVPRITSALRETPIPPALALTALARESLPHAEQRKAGSYYTDFRLALFLASRAIKLKPLTRDDLVIDPASGTGILLVAAAIAAFGADRQALDNFVRRSACAGDLSSSALRGVKLALASLACDLSSVEALTHRLRAGDSLTAGVSAWRDVSPTGFDLVIGNPPWEKLKISRHEHLGTLGALRHYGDDYKSHQALDGLREARSELADYVGSLEYELSGKGDPDLYKLFLALSSALVRHGGQIAMLVPAGLIRSEGTQLLREHLLSAGAELHIAVLDNKARFFSIDTRFKFLALNSIIDSATKTAPIVLEHASGTNEGVKRTGRACIGRRALASIRADLSVPEVRSDAEWRLFRRLSSEGVTLNDPAGPWHLQLLREVDMTNDRDLLARARSNGEVALIEGRMVHQFRHAAKVYLSGTGRRAAWAWQAPGEADLCPQFFVDPKSLSETVRERTTKPRVGFCDITGQTNERSMLAASIPAGVACGNKVPTIVFDMPQDDELLSGVFLAIANSFAFDWLLRRVITTTVNYFLLLSVPFPALDLDGQLARKLADLSHTIESGYEGGADADEPALATIRAELDALVMEAYGIKPSEANLIFRDFPLLDRGQPPLPHENRSTITRDLALLRVSESQGAQDDRLADRVDAALKAGAEGYIPSQLARRKPGVDGLVVP
jgi:hypothetical protein